MTVTEMNNYDIYIVSARSDASAAEELASSIRNYTLPKGTILPDASAGYHRIITDTEEKAMDETVRNTLAHSSFLIVLCSPDAKDDPGVNAKLTYFRELRNNTNIIAVIVRGDPADAFPDSFIEKKLVPHVLPDMTITEREETIEPIAADLRAEDPKRYKQLLRYETLRIIASVLGLHPDDLEQRHRSRTRKAMLTMLAVISAVCLFAAGIFLYLGIAAKREGDLAAEQIRLNTEITERTLNELPALFADEPEALSYIQETAEKVKEELKKNGISAGTDTDGQ
ncbi:MAG: hypothetical protein E7190_08295 [Erysipelotrichaceae bacterium]|nr:hypothetical protein [Erysipelotrichaceae bacterium]